VTWKYSQKTGNLSHNGKSVGFGYAGFGEGVNNPKAQDIPNIGPIPRGLYSIGVAFTHPKAGPMTMRLTPMKGTNTFGRDGFLIHGDNMSMNRTASNGCVIQNIKIRASIAVSNNRTLEVVE
jgi:hypothetical protein